MLAAARDIRAREKAKLFEIIALSRASRSDSEAGWEMVREAGVRASSLDQVFLSIECNVTVILEHVPAKLHDFADKNMLQLIDLARFLFAQVESPERKAR